MTGKIQNIVAIDDNKTKSHVPLLTWAHREPSVVLLDPDEGLVAYQYRLGERLGDRDTGVGLFIYHSFYC
ncbi:MAG: hypothetical protein LBI28_01310 [Treponema sp.]|jgi:hypothetical protein|nr:hypothetical protein [Treponema sp.]